MGHFPPLPYGFYKWSLETLAHSSGKQNTATDELLFVSKVSTLIDFNLQKLGVWKLNEKTNNV